MPFSNDLDYFPHLLIGTRDLRLEVFFRVVLLILLRHGLVGLFRPNKSLLYPTFPISRKSPMQFSMHQEISNVVQVQLLNPIERVIIIATHKLSEHASMQFPLDQKVSEGMRI